MLKPFGCYSGNCVVLLLRALCPFQCCGLATGSHRLEKLVVYRLLEIDCFLCKRHNVCEMCVYVLLFCNVFVR
jgi:hypothetical protein